MYVLGPWERAEIRGWRTSLSNVRRFVFVDEERSYAGRTGQANGDMGWIRVLSFREQQPQVWYEPRERGDDEWRPFGSRESQRDEAGAPRAQELEGRGDASRQNTGGKAGGENGNGRTQAQAPPARDGLAKRSADSFHSLPAPESNPGTGWGDRSYDPVQRTVFLAAHSATDRIALRYEYVSGLAALGIHPRESRVWHRDRGELSFAQAPRW
jgi:hypothetical protein